MNDMQQTVERNVRLLIGDLHMQLIILQAQLEAQRGAEPGVQPPPRHNGGDAERARAPT